MKEALKAGNTVQEPNVEPFDLAAVVDAAAKVAEKAEEKSGIGIHGTAEPDSIGRSSSHGCIRLANWDVVRLAEKVSAGTPVSIQ